jgi:steroid 5-alpha reductase family enzyme
VDVRAGGRLVNYGNLLQVSGASVLSLLVVHSVAFAIGRRIGRYNVVDVAWGVGYVAIAAVAAVLGHGDPTRRWLLLALVAIWGLRLSWHIQRKTAGKGEDKRYAALLRDAQKPGVAQVLRKVFLLQAFITWFVSFPLQLSAVTGATPMPLTVVASLGVALWLVGVTFEAVGDRQLKIFKADPANRGAVMDRGLWAWTRHPNYFGDATVWWGLWLVTVNGWPALATVGSPLLMTYFLVYVTGARLTEKLMAGRPGFADYTSRTSFFFPLPPRAVRR